MAPAQDQPNPIGPRLTRIPNPPVLVRTTRLPNGGDGPGPVDPLPRPVPRPVTTPGPQPGPTPGPAPTPAPAVPLGPALTAGVDANTVAVFPDQALAGYFWYVPQFQLVAPQPGATPSGSPFSYSFSVSGHDAQGNPVLDATITAKIQATLADATRAQIPSTDQSSAVRLNALQPSLVIPFLDSTTGTLTSTAVPAAEITQDGDVYSLVFYIQGDLARAAYGSLSTPGYQANPAQLLVQFSFTAYELIHMPVGPWWPEVLVAAGPRGDVAQSPQTLAAAEDASPSQQLIVSGAIDRADGPITSPSTGLIVQRSVWFNPVPVPVSRWVPVPITRTSAVDILVPCTDFGQLYIDSTNAANPQSVGCEDAIALGKLPRDLYTPVDALSSDDYQVFKSVSRPGVYLLVPHRYRVGRAAPDPVTAGVPAWAPLIRWIQEFDATHDTALPCRLQANLQPDVSPAAVGSLLNALAQVNPNPTLVLPTTFGSGISGFTVTGWNTTNVIMTVLDGDTIQLSADMTYADAVIMNEMLMTAAGESALVGNVSFSLTDGTSLGPLELHVDVVQLTGPWPDGPILVTAADSTSVNVTNNAENAAVVTQIISSVLGGHSQVLADGLTLALAAGTTATIPITTAAPVGGQLIAAFTLAPSSGAVIDQERIYVEDLHTTITIINDAQMNTNGIASVDVTAHLDTDTQTFTFTMTPDLPIFQFDLVQPIVADRQAEAGLLHLTATIHRNGQPDTQTGDFIADLHKGVLVPLSSVLATPA
jgi:hypothetical protein